jgi:hypothetical protein
MKVSDTISDQEHDVSRSSHYNEFPDEGGAMKSLGALVI